MLASYCPVGSLDKPLPSSKVLHAHVINWIDMQLIFLFSNSCRCANEVSLDHMLVHSSNLWILIYSFTMPDVYSIGLGGGSRVRYLESGKSIVGPDSVGHHVCPIIIS